MPLARTILILLFATRLAAQARSITGIVSDTEGVAIPGVTITISGPSLPYELDGHG